MSFWMGLDLWNHEVKDVVQAYPDAEWREAIDEGKPTRAWRLTIAPVPTQDELRYVLADLDVGRAVAIHQHGRIAHSPKCEVPLDSHAALLPNLKLPQETYLVDLVYRPSPRDASWPTQPKAFIMNPEVSVRTYPRHPHMYVGSSGSWACPLSPQDTQWRWKRGATVAYLDQVAIWLLKTAVWARTGAGLAGMGKWIGSDTSHDPASLISSIKASDPCWCGSGVCYEGCHLQTDVMKAITMQIMKSN